MIDSELPLTPDPFNLTELRETLQSAELARLLPPLASAYRFAEQAHQDQIRDDGSPYIHHCGRVLRNAITLFAIDDREALQAALLHDVVEDTGVALGELQLRFGQRTAAWVALLTKPELLPGESYPQRTARYLQRLETDGSRLLVALKLADRFDNIDDSHLMPDHDKIRRYLQETDELYLPLAERHFPSAAAVLCEKLTRLRHWLDPLGASHRESLVGKEKQSCHQT